MMTDTPESVTLVPIDRIEVLNSRDRNMKVFEETPMLRLIHNRYFVEAGVNNFKQIRFNFMYTF